MLLYSCPIIIPSFIQQLRKFVVASFTELIKRLRNPVHDLIRTCPCFNTSNYFLVSPSNDDKFDVFERHFVD